MSVTAKLREEINRVAVILQYEGTAFNGWQIQNEGRTVQGEFEKSLRILTGKEIRVTAAGRTDAGAHALGQVAHFDINANFSLRKLCINLNGILDNDVSIKNAFFVHPDFHARFDAIQREYLYLIYNYPLKSPLMINRAMWVSQPLCIGYLKKVSEYLIGEKDFASFCKKTSVEENTFRKIYKIDIQKKQELIIFRISGNAFLHNMIRVMIGTMLYLFKEKCDPACVKDILSRRDRNAGGTTAPAYGLYLNKVSYDPDLGSMESAF